MQTLDILTLSPDHTVLVSSTLPSSENAVVGSSGLNVFTKCCSGTCNDFLNDASRGSRDGPTPCGSRCFRGSPDKNTLQRIIRLFRGVLSRRSFTAIALLTLVTGE